MKQTRIVLNSKHKPKAEEILQTTGIDSLSQLFALLLVNYGDALVNALKGNVVQHNTSPSTSLAAPIREKSAAPKKFQPISGF